MSRLVQLPWGDWVDPKLVECVRAVSDSEHWSTHSVVVTAGEIVFAQTVARMVNGADPDEVDRATVDAERLRDEVAAIINGKPGDPYRTEGA